IRQTIGEAQALPDEARQLETCLTVLCEATEAMLGCDDPRRRLANATLYLDGLGHVVIGWMWLRQALVAARALEKGAPGASDRAFYEGKMLACRYFSRYELPLAQQRLALCGTLDATCLDAPQTVFAAG